MIKLLKKLSAQNVQKNLYENVFHYLICLHHYIRTFKL